MHINQKKGFTLVDVIMAVSIVALLGAGIGGMTFASMRLWRITQSHIKAQDEARAAFQLIAGEIREMQIADNGSYAIESGDADTLIFYANVDDDVNREKIKYELQASTLYRWVAESDGGSPPQYAAFSDSTRSIVIENVIPTGSLFEYYDDSYTGSSSAMSLPLTINEVRLIKLHVYIDYDPGQTPNPLEIETNIALRNIKDNL